MKLASNRNGAGARLLAALCIPLMSHRPASGARRSTPRRGSPDSGASGTELPDRDPHVPAALPAGSSGFEVALQPPVSGGTGLRRITATERCSSDHLAGNSRGTSRMAHSADAGSAIQRGTRYRRPSGSATIGPGRRDETDGPALWLAACRADGSGGNP